MLDGFFRSAKFLLEEISKPLRYNSRDFSAREPDLITGSRCATACALKVRAAQDPTVPIRGQVAVPRVSAASSPPRGPQTAHLAHCLVSRQRSAYPTDSRHSALAARTGLHAPTAVTALCRLRGLGRGESCHSFPPFGEQRTMGIGPLLAQPSRGPSGRDNASG